MPGSLSNRGALMTEGLEAKGLGDGGKGSRSEYVCKLGLSLLVHMCAGEV